MLKNLQNVAMFITLSIIVIIVAFLSIDMTQYSMPNIINNMIPFTNQNVIPYSDNTQTQIDVIFDKYKMLNYNMLTNNRFTILRNQIDEFTLMCEIMNQSDLTSKYKKHLIFNDLTHNMTQILNTIAEMIYIYPALDEYTKSLFDFNMEIKNYLSSLYYDIADKQRIIITGSHYGVHDFALNKLLKR